MTAILDQRTAGTALWCRRIAWFSLVLLLTAVGSHRFGFLDTGAFLNVLATVVAFVGLAILAGIVAFRRIWRDGELGGSDVLVGLAVSALVLLPFAGAAYLALTLPRLADVSTDTRDPPSLPAGSAMRTSAMNPVLPPTRDAAAMQALHYPEVNGRRYDLPAEQVLDLVLAELAGRGWPITGRQPTAIGQPVIDVEALAKTPILAFPADVGIRLTDEGTATYVDMRSSSRYGPHDLGENAWRIGSFLDDLDADVATQAGLAPQPAE